MTIILWQHFLLTSKPSVNSKRMIPLISLFLKQVPRPVINRTTLNAPNFPDLNPTLRDAASFILKQ